MTDGRILVTNSSLELAQLSVAAGERVSCCNENDHVAEIGAPARRSSNPGAGLSSPPSPSSRPRNSDHSLIVALQNAKSP
jgi:hypothetical protein